jgi:hypothetical protein
VEITREGFQSEDLITPIDEAIPEVRAITPRADKRATYCHQQAAECALAATTVVSGEIKEAYLNIERAWLQLAPEMTAGEKVELLCWLPKTSSSLSCLGRLPALGR